MSTVQALKMLHEIKAFYDSIPAPKYRHADLNTLKRLFERLQGLKDDLGHEKAHTQLINAMSQVIANLEESSRLAKIPSDRIWPNLSERGMNKAIPAIMKRQGQSWPVEYKDRWGNTCHVNSGQWGVKNYRVTQGYVWDTQSDMALALLGVILSLIALSKIHDKQIMKLSD